MPIIAQNLKINNLRNASAKSISLHTNRELIQYSLKNVPLKAMFTLPVFEILLSEGRPVLSPAQRGTGSESVNKSVCLSSVLIIRSPFSTLIHHVIKGLSGKI